MSCGYIDSNGVYHQRSNCQDALKTALQHSGYVYYETDDTGQVTSTSIPFDVGGKPDAKSLATLQGLNGAGAMRQVIPSANKKTATPGAKGSSTTPVADRELKDLPVSPAPESILGPSNIFTFLLLGAIFFLFSKGLK